MFLYSCLCHKHSESLDHYGGIFNVAKQLLEGHGQNRNSLYHAYLKMQHATFISTRSTSYMPTRVTCLHQWERVDFWQQLCRSKRRLVITLTFSFLTRSSTIQKCKVFSFAFEAKVKATALSERYIQLKVSSIMLYYIVFESRNRSHAL